MANDDPTARGEAPAAGPSSPAPSTDAKPAPRNGEAPDDALAALDLARGELDDEDLRALEQAVEAVDFAARRATPERLARLKATAARLASLCEQFEKGVRTRDADAPPLSEEDAKR